MLMIISITIMVHKNNMYAAVWPKSRSLGNNYWL